MSGPNDDIVARPGEHDDLLVYVERLRREAVAFQRTVEDDLWALREELRSCSGPTGGVMEDEWATLISGDRLVKFTYLRLPEGKAFLTAQIAGHDVVYSVIVEHAEPFSRDGVERHFDYEFRPNPN